MEDYLERIYLLIQEHRVARVKDIATSRGVKNPSVNNAIIELKKRGYVIQEPYGYVLLTKEGEVEAERILKRHKLLREFLLHLGVSEEVADEDACGMEHFLNDETLKAIDVFCKKQVKAKSKS
jgi:Mn-dependent DtxR family transcriptional regulator